MNDVLESITLPGRKFNHYTDVGFRVKNSDLLFVASNDNSKLCFANLKEDMIITIKGRKTGFFFVVDSIHRKGFVV